MKVEFTKIDNGTINIHTDSGVPIGSFSLVEDGTFVFWPVQGRTGYWPAWVLRTLADKLDELNEEWTTTVKALF